MLFNYILFIVIYIVLTGALSIPVWAAGRSRSSRLLRTLAFIFSGGVTFSIAVFFDNILSENPGLFNYPVFLEFFTLLLWLMTILRYITFLYKAPNREAGYPSLWGFLGFITFYWDLSNLEGALNRKRKPWLGAGFLIRQLLPSALFILLSVVLFWLTKDPNNKLFITPYILCPLLIYAVIEAFTRAYAAVMRFAGYKLTPFCVGVRKSTSITDFWANHFGLWFTNWMKEYIDVPLFKRMKPSLATLVSFTMLGFALGYVYGIPYRGSGMVWDGTPMIFFIWHGIMSWLEQSIILPRTGKKPSIIWRLICLVFLFLTSPLLHIPIFHLFNYTPFLP